MPLHTLTIPFLGAITVANLLWVEVNSERYTFVHRRMPSVILRAYNRCFSWFTMRVNPYNCISFSLAFLPLCFYLYFSITRHMQPDISIDKKIEEIAKAFGMVSMLSMSIFFLVPVTRHGILTHSLPPEKIIRVHIWCGSIAILTAVLHGVIFIYQWAKNGDVLEELFPRSECLTSKEYTSKDCQDSFKNLVGLLAVVCLTILGVFSLNWIRRLKYSLFYKAHILLGPLGLAFMVLHFHRMALYLSPSLLYYLAGNVPVLLKTVIHWRSGGVALSTVTDLSLDSSLVAMTFHLDDKTAAIYRSGSMVKISYLNVSALSHPFTMNLLQTATGTNEGLIIFRTTGHFTKNLAKGLLTEQHVNDEETTEPRVTTGTSSLVLLMDGFYGNRKMFHDVSRHRSVLIVAGGVGITPYLSLLSELLCKGSTTDVHLHWICRDMRLIEFVKEKFFTPYESSDNNAYSNDGMIHITLHCTSQEEVSQSSSLTRNLTSVNGRPFSAYSRINHQDLWNNVSKVIIFSSIAWSGMFILWYFHLTFVVNETSLHVRLYGIIVLIPSSILIGGISMFATETMKNALDLWTYSPVDNDENCDDTNTVDTGISLSTKGKEWTFMESAASRQREGDEMRIKVELSLDRERPEARSIVRDFLLKSSVSEKLGVFVCGPNSLANEVRAAVANEHEDVRLPIYEETYEM